MAARRLPASLVRGFQRWRQTNPGGTFRQFVTDLRAEQAGYAAWVQTHPGASITAYAAAIRHAQQVGQIPYALAVGFRNWQQGHPGGTIQQYGAALRALQAARAGATATPSGTPGWLLPAVLLGGGGAIVIGAVVVSQHPHARSHGMGPTGGPGGSVLRSKAA